MNKNLKISIIVSLILLVIASLILFFLFRGSNIKKEAVKKDGEWIGLEKEVFNDFIDNNFTPELAKEVDRESFVLYGDLEKQYLSSNFSILYARDGESIYMRFFCNSIALFVKIKDADLESFEILDNCYSRDKDKVYFTNIVIPDADPKTFEVLDENYSKDSENVYFQEHTILGADIDSFKIILNDEEKGYYSRDKEYFYRKHLAVSNLIPDNFSLDKVGDIEKGLYDCIDEEIDKYSFEVIDDNFSKDKNNAYLFVDGEGSLIYCNKIEEADPLSLEVIDDNFSKDEDNVYYQELKIPEADPETFTKLSDDYSKDEENVYLNEKIIEDADPETFEVISDDDDEHYAKDEDNVYEDTEIIEDADPETFDPEDDPQEDEENPQEDEGNPQDDEDVNEEEDDIEIIITPPPLEGSQCYFKKTDGPYVERHCKTD